MKHKKENIVVLDMHHRFLSKCTRQKANRIDKSGRGHYLTEFTIMLHTDKKNERDQKEQIIIAAKSVCYICGKKIPYDKVRTIDHVIPRSRDKSLQRSYKNKQCCCLLCNQDKGSRTIKEYVDYIKANREKYPQYSDQKIKQLKKMANRITNKIYGTVKQSD